MFGKKAGWSLALLVIILVVVLLGRSCKPRASEDASKANPGTPPTATSENAEDRKAAGSRPPLVDSRPDSAAAFHFRNFFLRPIGAVPSTTVEPRPLAEITAKVMAEYEAIARETGETALPIGIDLSLMDPTLLVRFRSPRMPVTDCLKLLAGASGCQLIGTGPKFQFKPIPDDGKKETRTLDLGHLDFSKEPNWGQIDDLNALVPVSSPASPGESDAKPALQDHLSQFGLDSPSSAAIQLKRTPAGQWTATLPGATLTDVLRLRTFAEITMASEEYGSLRVMSKLVRLSPGTSWPDDGHGNEQETEATLQRLSSQPGVTVTTFPGFTTHYGELSVFAVPTEDPENPAPAIRVRYASQPLGLGIEDRFEISGPVHLASATKSPQSVIQSTVMKAPDGASYVYLRSGERTDPTGRAIPTSPPPEK